MENNIISPTARQTNKMNIILPISLLVTAIFFSAIGAGIYYLVSDKSTKNNTSTQNISKEELSNSEKLVEKENNTDKVVINQNQEYTNPNFPNLKILYNDNWIINVEETEITSFKDYTKDKIFDTKVVLSKDNVQLVVTLSPSPAFGYGPSSCFKAGEMIIEKIDNTWFRAASSTGYTYIGNSIIYKGDEQFQSTAELAVSMNGGNIEELVLCSQGNDSSILTTSTNATLIEQQNTMPAIVNIKLVTPEPRETDLIQEVDELVKMIKL